MADWTLAIEYDYRFGALRVTPVDPEGNPKADFVLRVSDVLRHSPISPHELQAYLTEAQQPMLPMEDIESIRQRAIRETDCAGMTVLDIGGYDGWAAAQTLQQGAERAICLDNHQYEHYGWKEKKYEGVEYVNGDFMEEQDWDCRGNLPGWVRKAPDIIIFYNVLYHLKNPWAALEKVRNLLAPGGEMLLCTLFRYHIGPWAYLYEPRECNPTDETVYWGLSIEALERLLKVTGWEFKQIGMALDRVVYRCKPIPGFRVKHGNS